MIKTNILPDNYQIVREYDILKNKKDLKIMYLITFILFIPFIVLYFFIFNHFNLNFIYLLLIYLLIIIFHELIHGLFFKLGGKSKLKFNLQLQAASCGAPGYYYKRNYYMLIGLSPFLIISPILITLFFIYHKSLLFYILLMIHTAGCSCDFYIFFELLKYDKKTLIEDTGIKMIFYNEK